MGVLLVRTAVASPVGRRVRRRWKAHSPQYIPHTPRTLTGRTARNAPQMPPASWWQALPEQLDRGVDHLHRTASARHGAAPGGNQCKQKTGLERGNVVMVVLGNDDCGYAGKHTVEALFGQVVDIVLGRVYNADPLCITASQD